MVIVELLDEFWRHAVIPMVYIRNRKWSTGANGIPWHIITNKTPDLSIIRTFGCPSYAHIDQSLRNKIEDKSFKGFFVGYALTH
jgi:hypothetical protein